MLKFPWVARRILAASQTCLTDGAQNDLLCFTIMPAKALKHRGFMEMVLPQGSPTGGHQLRFLQTSLTPSPQPHTKPTASDPHSPLACRAPAPQDPWGLQVQCNGSAGSPRPGFHPCTQRTHPGWLLKGKQNLNPTGLKSLVEHNGFFPPHLSPEPWAHGLR